MVIGCKDIFKMAGIFIVSCCAVFVCTLFLNYNMDIVSIKDQITSGPVMIFYDAQVLMGKVVCCVSGGCLLITTVIMLLFYIKHYIDGHRRELGILKALGYSKIRIASGFGSFGLSVLMGTAVGFGGAFAMLPRFYRVQNEENLLPEFSVHFHPLLAVCLVALPTVFFALLSILYSYCQLNMSVLELLKGSTGNGKERKKRKRRPDDELPFLKELRKTTVRGRAALVFFIAFASFCYAAMMQMSASMDELASIMMAVMMIGIGIILACTTLFLAITTVIHANTKTIAMMRVFGYSLNACSRAILGGYRPVAYIGFAVGTVYQYALLKIMMTFVFRNLENMPEYGFDAPAFIITLISFIFLYELIMYCYAVRIKKLSVKEIMLE